MWMDKPQMLALHEAELAAWEQLLAGLDDEQRTGRPLPDGLTVKDTLAHLAAWQARTNARLEAALAGRQPVFPPWPVELDAAESAAAVDRANAWILAANRVRPWADVHQEWHQGFRRFLELLSAVPEDALRPGGRLAWLAEYEPLEGYPGFHDFHHAEHRAWLEAWLSDQTMP
jgi:hypothetical protein